MPFWLHDTKTIAFSRRISTRNRLMMSCCLLGAGIILWGCFLYLPGRASTLHVINENEGLKKQIIAYKELIQKQEPDQSDSALNHEYQKLIRSHVCVQDSVDFMFMKLKELGLTCKGLHPIGTKKEQIIHKEYFNVTVNGSFKKIITFLEHIQKSNCCISLCSLALQRDTGKKVSLQATVRLINVV